MAVKPLDAIAGAQAKASKGGKAPSLLGQLGSLVKGVIPGLGGLVKGEVTSLVKNPVNHILWHNPVTAVAKATYDNRPGKVDTSKGVGNALGQALHNSSQSLHKNNELVGSMASSLNRTGGRFVDLASVPLGKQTLAKSKYGVASKQGTILPTIVEDAGNVALVAGPATKALGAAGTAASEAGRVGLGSALTKTAGAIEKGTGLAHNISDTPVLPIRLAAKGLSKTLALGAEEGGALAGRGLLTRALEDASPKVGEQLTKARGYLADNAQLKTMRGAFTSGRAEEVLATKPIALDFGEALKAEGLDLDTQHAVSMVKQGLGPTLERINAAPTGTIRRRLLNDTFGVEQRPTPEAMTKALEWSKAGVPAPIDEAWGRVERQINRVQEMKLTGEGMKNPLNPEQLLHEPMQSRIDASIEPIDAKIQGYVKDADQLTKKAARARGIADNSAAPESKLPVRTAITAEKLGGGIEVKRAKLADMTDHDAFHQNKANRVWEDQRRVKLGETMISDAKTAGRLGELRGTRTTLAKQAERVANKASSKVINATLERNLLESALKEGPSSHAPGMYQPALRSAERARMSLLDQADAIEERFPLAARRLRREAEQMPQTMADLHAQDVKPQYVPGGYEEPVRGHGTGLAPRMQETALAAERAKKEGNVLKSWGRIGEQLGRDVSKMGQNKTIAGVRDEFGTTFRKLAEKDMEGIAPGSPEHVDLQSRLNGAFDGHDIAAEMKRRGMVAIDGIPEQQINAETVFMPERLAKEYKRMTDNTPPGGLLKAYDRTTRAWKTLNLPLNPGWQIGNAVGNPIMGMMATGTPQTWLEEFGKVPSILKEEAASGTPIVPPRLHGIGGALDDLREATRMDSEKKGPLGRLIQKSYDMNERVDTRNRIATYNTFLRQGYDQSKALEMALKGGGDFSNLSPIERNYVKRALPFYPWQKHITRLSADLLAKHPGRVATGLHLGQLASGEDPSDPKNLRDPNDFTSGMLKLGQNWFLPIANLNPFDSALRSPFTSPKAALSSLNPVIKGAAYGLADINLQKGRMNTRPKGSGNLDASGNQTLGPASLKEDLYYLTQQSPLTRLGFGALTPANARYDTGASIKRANRPIKAEGGKRQQVSRNLGLPLPLFINERRLATTKARQARDKRSALKKAR